MLVLGVGLGSVPVILQQHFGQKAHYTAVEIDEVVIDLAKQFLPSPILNVTDFHCADAFDFVQNDENQYDLIAVDVFFDLDTPAEFRSDDFLEGLKKCLLQQKGSRIVYNTLTTDRGRNQSSMRFFQRSFSQHFPQSTFIETSGNRLLIYTHL